MWPVIRDSPRGSSIYVLDIANATKIYSGPRCPTHGGRYHACNTGMIKLDHGTRNGSETAEISISEGLGDGRWKTITWNLFAALFLGLMNSAYHHGTEPPPTVIVLQIYVLILSGQTFRGQSPGATL